MSKLTDISKITKLKHLKTLRLEECKSLHDLSPLQHLEDLRLLSLDDSASVDSISPLLSLKELRVFYFPGRGRILDDSTEVLLKLPKLQFVSFAERRGQKPTDEDIKAAIRARGLDPDVSIPQVNLED